MPGLVPGIHAIGESQGAWIPAAGAGMTSWQNFFCVALSTRPDPDRPRFRRDASRAGHSTSSLTKFNPYLMLLPFNQTRNPGESPMRPLAFLSAALLFAAAPAFAQTETYALDSTHAHVQYSVDH